MRVLLLPGLDGTGRLFRQFRASAERSSSAHRYEPVAYDSTDPIAKVRERLDREREPTAIVAESFSGPIAISIAASPPSHLRALVLVATFSRPPAPRVLAKLLGPRWFRRPPGRLAARLALVGLDADADLVDEVRSTIASVDAAVLAARARTLFEVDVADALARIELPLLVLRASHDRLVRPASLTPLPTHAQVVELAGPHLLLQRRPDECVATIERFLVSRAG